MDWKKRGKQLLYPPMWTMLLLLGGSVCMLVFVFTKELEESPIAYIVYVLSFYATVAWSVWGIQVFPKMYRAAKQKIYNTKYGNRYMTDMAFRTHVSLYPSLAINLLYVGVNVLSYVLYDSVWFVILAIYYVILSVMRFLLLKFMQKNQVGENVLGEWKRARLCAIILLWINFILTGAVLMILYQDKGYEYHGILIYVMAAYTFYMTIRTIVDMVKNRKYNSPVMTTTKIVSLAAALVSVLALETAMFSQFGAEMSAEDQKIMIAATGAGVSFITIGLSSYMIVRSVKEINILRRKRNE